MISLRDRTVIAPLALMLLTLGCGTSSAPRARGDTGGGASGSDDGPGGSGGATAGTGGGGVPTGGDGGSGGATPDAGEGGTSGSSGPDGSAGTGGDRGGLGGLAPDASLSEDAAPVSPDAPVSSGGPLDFGGVNQLVLVPLQHTPTPVPPLIAPECPGDPTMGFTEYEDSFVVQRPYTLAAADRIKYEGGIYTFWVKSTDPAHKAGGTTAPRTEARYSDMSTGELIWTGDVMFESPSKTCIFQIHNVNSPIAIYLRVVGDRMFDLSTGTTILTGSTGKWFNLKVAFNIQTREVRTYINNCLKETSHAPNTASVNKWYFKHGVYTCDSGTCTSHYKNIHLYQRGSTDKFNVMSPYP